MNQIKCYELVFSSYLFCHLFDPPQLTYIFGSQKVERGGLVASDPYREALVLEQGTGSHPGKGCLVPT